MVLLGACSGSEADERPPVTVLEGNVPENECDRIELKDRIAPYTYTDSSLAEDPCKGGSFKLRVRKKELGYLELSGIGPENVELYLEAGDSLVLQKGYREAVEFEGKGAARNLFLKQQQAFKDSLSMTQDSIFHREKEAFLKGLEKRRAAYKAFRKRRFKSSEQLYGERFKELVRSRDRIDLAYMRFSYPDLYEYNNPNDTVSFGKDYWGFLDAIDLSDTLLLQVPEYLSFAYDVANKYALENKGQQTNASFRELLFRTILDEFKGKARDVLLTYFMLEQQRYREKGVPQDLWERYRKEIGDPSMLEFVEKRIKKGKEEAS